MDASLAGGRPARRTRLAMPDGRFAVVGLAVAIVCVLALVPLGFLLWQSFHTPRTFSRAAVFTWSNYTRAYTNPEFVTTLWTSVKFAIGSSAIAFVLGTTLAWIVERTEVPFRRVFFVLGLVPLIIPGILFTIAWIFIASPKIGWINLTLQALFGTDRVFVDIYTLGGMMWVEGLHYSPMAFLLMSAAFKAMDPNLEESAVMSGAGVLQTLWRVTLRLVWPAILATVLILFIRSVESFETPALLGLPVGIQVFTSSIYQAVHQYPSQTGLASAYSIVLLVITSVGIWVQSRVSASGSRYATMTGKGFRPRRIDIGRWKWAAVGFVLVYFALVVVLPFLVLLWSSLQPFYAVPSRQALGNLTLDPYRFILSYPTLPRSVLNSVLLAVATATVVMLLTAVICWIVVKSKVPGRWLLDNLASLPMVFPGIVLGLALMIFYLNVDVGIYGTIWIMLIAYVTRFMPYGLRYNTTSLIQIHKELEESAAMAGASWLTTFRRVVLPLMKPGLVAGWIYVVIVSIRELSASILLYSPGNEVLSIVIWELWENGQFVELSALSVMFITALGLLVALAQWVGGRFGVREAA